ncbi:MAG: sigma-54-dependent Fis family transcriptional regulator [Candidatus Eisenbacteria bacterium]|uniref:Sigma-54-dependent Fis family transcriptional regulator n=1 Tax=Eiseniibacteriota bacterium TaxID=2212470 RepID=A0A956LYB0_UNCEI|nr:sigma-54-dependent Fis family transcriptional regulator [Candidatus Eisenbacteria bacterium]
MSDQPKILIVDDQKNLLESLKRVLEGFGYQVAVAPDAEKALDLVDEETPDLIIIDLNLPGKSGQELIDELQERNIESTLVVLTGNASIDSAIWATRRGVFDYLEKPVNADRLRSVADRGVERSSLRKEVAQLRRETMRHGKLHQLVGRAPKMQELYRLIDQIAPTNASVLITGESGTGKEVIARTLHRLSPRSQRPFVAINCAAIPETLLESEIFGHEKGAFTGATAARAGCFEQAHEGTLFLDEIGEMPVDLQSKLLRVLEDQKVRRVGGGKEIGVDARVLAATNANVDGLLESGKFREDLYFRLNVFTLEIPPLRDRREDVPVLAEHFLNEFRNENDTRCASLSEEAIGTLRGHDWPGNVRELRNAIQRAAILCSEGEIQPHHLPPTLRPRGSGPQSDGKTVTVQVGTSIAETEKALILATLQACGGKKPEAAEILGISLKTLYTRLHDYDEIETNGAETTS